MRSVSVLLIALLALTAVGCADRSDEPPDDRIINLERNSEFDGATLRIFVTLEDGAEASVNSDDDVIGSTEEATPLPGHRARAFAFLRDREAGTSLAYGLLSWDPVNPEDYLVFGWWAEFPGQHPPVLSLADSLQYAIVDGPELDHGLQPDLSVEGTASYVGQAGGLYSYVPGGDPGDNAENLVIEEYEGMLTLTADFRDRTVRGCIGCEGDLVTRRAHFGVILGPGLGDALDAAGDYKLHLATSIIREDGTFERERVTVEHPTRVVTRSEGFWGGAFSNRPDTDGNPRLVAGFSNVSYTESDGSEGAFFGSFLGLSAAFGETGESGPPSSGEIGSGGN